MTSATWGRRALRGPESEFAGQFAIAARREHKQAILRGGVAHNLETSHRRFRLIALDLDGTLVGKSLVIPERNQQAVRAAMAAGCHVTIATGRSLIPTGPFARQLDLNTPLVLCQGALIQDHRDGSLIHCETLPLPLAAEVAAFAKVQGLVTQAYAVDGSVFTVEHDAVERSRIETITGVSVIPVDDLLAAFDRPPLKFLFIEKPERVTTLLHAIRAHFGLRVAVVRSNSQIVEITAPNVSKGSALAALAAHLGVTREATLAMGDHDNDAEMLAWAGLGIAMHTASPSAAAAADLIAPNVPPTQPARIGGDGRASNDPHDEAVGWAIERYVLGTTLATTLGATP
jgi:Cof subfamily protein (haloacid dehalogenase superfamily)